MGRTTAPEREMAMAHLLRGEVGYNLAYWLNQRKIRPARRSAAAVGRDYHRVKPDPGDLPPRPSAQASWERQQRHREETAAVEQEAQARWLLLHLLTPRSPDAVLSRADALALRRRLLAKVRDRDRRAAGVDGTVRMAPETGRLLDELADRLGHASRSAALREVVEWAHRRLARRRHTGFTREA